MKQIVLKYMKVLLNFLCFRQGFLEDWIHQPLGKVKVTYKVKPNQKEKEVLFLFSCLLFIFLNVSDRHDINVKLVSIF